MNEKGNKPEPSESPGTPLKLRRELCRGCTHCLRVCPTEAIRVRKGKAEIRAHRCVGCGECMRICPHRAWTVENSRFDREFSRAVLDPSAFGQWGRVSPRRIKEAFSSIGFASAADMTQALRSAEQAISDFLFSDGRPFPAISSNCPAVVQLVQVKFPSLLENLVPVAPYYEIAAALLKEAPLSGSLNVVYIVPCPAKASAASKPRMPGGDFSAAVSLAEVFGPLRMALKDANPGLAGKDEARSGIEWAVTGGESRRTGAERSLKVDGIHRVSGVMELAENGRLDDVAFIEAWGCPGGCVGGPLNVENPFLAAFHAFGTGEGAGPGEDVAPLTSEANFRIPPPKSRGAMRLDRDLGAAMEKLRRIDETLKRFPGIDCGSCGCPNCLALAEDVVQGFASETDCVVLR